MLSILAALAVCVVCGCNADQQAFNESNDQTWIITELRADHGHDTMESDNGGISHNYFCAVVLKRNDETLNLLYENNLPNNIELHVGDHYRVDGLDSAEYSDNWRGYWLRDVRLIPVTRK